MSSNPSYPLPDPNADLTNNPFAALLQPASDFQQITEKTLEECGDEVSMESHGEGSTTEQLHDVGLEKVSKVELGDEDMQTDVQAMATEKTQINNTIQRIFMITVDKDPAFVVQNIPSYCVYLSDLSADSYWLDWDNLDQGLFERLLMDNPGEHLICTTEKQVKDARCENDAKEPSLLKYLLFCFKRSQHESKQKDSEASIIERCRKLIVSYAVTALTTPEVLNATDIHAQMVDLFHDVFFSGDIDVMCSFLDALSVNLLSDAEYTCSDVLLPILQITNKKLNARMSLLNSTNYVYCEIVQCFTTKPLLAKVLLNHMTPSDQSKGVQFEKNCVGALLNISCLGDKDRGPFEFFDKPSRSTQQQHQSTEASIWMPLSVMNDKLYQIFRSMLKCSPEIKHEFLSWIGNCLHFNGDRSKMWSVMTSREKFVSDNFMLNLGAVLLRLCQPFTSTVNNNLLKIDASYTLATMETDEQRKKKKVPTATLR